MDRLLNT